MMFSPIGPHTCTQGACHTHDTVQEKDGAAGSSASSSSATQKQKKTDQLGATWESLASWETDSDSEASGSTAGRAGPGSSGSSGSSNSGAARVERLKLRLLSAVASLDRGLAATVGQAGPDKGHKWLSVAGGAS